MSDQREQMNLSLQRAEVDVVLTGPDGVERKWLLRELSGSKRNTYLNKMSNRIKVGPGGNTSIKNFDGFQFDLLRLCLLDEDGEKVDKETIEGLPSSAQQALFEKAQEISSLEKEEDDEGNG